MSGLASLFRDGPCVYTVAPGEPFLPAIAERLLAAYADDPLGLADVTLYLPSRRAKREMASAFLAATEGETALFLPSLRALGDVDEEDLILAGAPLDAETSLPPPADGLERRLVLARFLRRARQAAGEPVPGWPAALLAADELGRVLDEFHTEGVCLSKLQTLAQDTDVPLGAEHWQRSLDFLKVVTEVWPAWIAQQHRMDGAERRRRLMEAMRPEGVPGRAGEGPIIVAGSLGTVPATARFMRRVAEAPNGIVVLPGMDLTLDQEAWEAIEPPHPQALFHQLLRRFEDCSWPDGRRGLARGDVQPWCGEAAVSPRAAFLTLALRPAEATSDWHGRLHGFKREHEASAALEGLSIATAETEDEEAGFVALLMRETLATPGRTCTLVTPDRNLARRVRSKLKLWQVEVDDSGGVPLGGTYRGTFMRAVARWLCDVSDPVALAEVCGHTLCRIGEKAGIHERDARALNRALRGVRPGPGFDGLRRLLGSEGFRVTGRRADEVIPRALALIDRLEAAAAPFLAARGAAEQLQAHVAVAQALATAVREDGETRLWRYEDGEALAILMADLLAQEALLPQDPCDYADLFDALIAGPVVRKRGGHPRLAILGLLEARLQHADRVILAGLNEGVWPAEPRADAFLSRPMRATLGLPSPEMVVGRTAHDFAQLAAAPEVILTRSKRQGTKPADASRWLVRLESFVAAVGQHEARDRAPELRAWLARLHGLAPGEAVTPAAAPAPRPPVEIRPDRFSVSEVGTLVRDPYAIYARKVLDLPALGALTSGVVDAREKGEFYHEVFARFAERWRKAAPPDPVRALTELSEGLMAERAMPDALRALWRPRLRVAFETYAQMDKEARERGDLVGTEIGGAWAFERGGRSYTLTARADRIDVGPDGRAAIIDYKTGNVPSMNQAVATLSPQVALTAIMVREGAFADHGLPSGTDCWGAGFVRSLPSEAPSEVLKHSSTFAHSGGSGRSVALEDALRDAERGFLSWLDHFADPDTPYLSQPRPQFRNDYGDYDHLARRGEWSAQADGEGD